MPQKEPKVTLEWLEEKIRSLTSPELEAFEKRIDALIEEKRKFALAHKMSKEQLLNLYNSHGFYPKPGDKFWRIGSVHKGHGMYGWQIGEYTHSCHIDTTDLKVLLVVEPSAEGDTYVIDYADLWLDGPIIV